MSQQVYMPVRCIDKFCEHCEELEIAVDGLNFTDGCTDYGRENHIYCKHYKRCTAIENHLQEPIHKAEEELQMLRTTFNALHDNYEDLHRRFAEIAKYNSVLKDLLRQQGKEVPDERP